MNLPFVSVIMPIRNEAAFIVGCLTSVLEQDYPSDRMEILIADGISTDNTRLIIQKICDESPIQVTILDNPKKIVPTGMNLAIRRAKGDVIIRIDGHCNIAPDYVRRCVEHIQKDDVDGVGGPIESVGESALADVISVGMSSPFGVGNSAFRTISDKDMLVDTVPFPAYTRRIVQHIGLYDEDLFCNEDDEYNYRLRKMGGKLLLASDVHSKYYNRTSFGRLWHQYFRYGLWKVRILQKHTAQMSPRQFAPLGLVLALFFSAFLALTPVLLPAAVLSSLPDLVVRLPSSFYSAMTPASLTPATVIWLLALAAPGLYLLANLSAAGFTASRRGFKYLPLLPFVFGILHLSYGLGFLAGLIKFWNRWGDQVGRVPEFAPAGSTPLQPVYAAAGATMAVNAPVSSFERSLLSAVKVETSPAYLGENAYGLKRVFDILASFMGLLFLSPLFLFIAVLIKRDSRGPVFYRAMRVGKNGKPFQIIKFRTMRTGPAGEAGPSVTGKDDPRITPLGRWLRVTKLNEFPQLWNVLKGEMSLVGPRPEDPDIVAMWPAPVRRLVLSIRPGMTSPASVVYRNEEELLTGEAVMNQYLYNILPDKLRLDQLYVRNNTFATDLDVIFWTLIGLLPTIKHAAIPEGTLYWGPLSSLFNRYFTWFLADTIIAFLAVGVAGAIWRMEQVINLGLELDITVAVGIAIVFSVINYLLGLGRIAWRNARPAYIFDLAFSSGLTTTLLFFIDWSWRPSALLPRGLILITGLFAFIGFTVMRYRERLITGLAGRWVAIRGQASTLGERVLIIGAGECGQLAAWLLQKSNLTPALTVVGMVDDDPSKYRMRIDGQTVLGRTHDIPTLVRQKNIGVILYAISNVSPEQQEHILKICRALPVRLVIIPELIKIVQDYLLKSTEATVIKISESPFTSPGVAD